MNKEMAEASDASDGASSSSPPTTTEAYYAKPRPRQPRSPAHAAEVRIRNRRREYLERNPEYFDSLEHELTDPLLYDALIRRFQSAAEREKEGRTKGYSRVLEVDLLRGEAKLTHLAQDPSQTTVSSTAATDVDVYIREYADISTVPDASSSSSSKRNGLDFRTQHVNNSNGEITEELLVTRSGLGNGVGVGKGGGEPPQTREQGRQRWKDFLSRRFVIGRDEDFDYRPVDENDDYDVLERREEEDAWFDNEEEGWASESTAGTNDDEGIRDNDSGGLDAKPCYTMSRSRSRTREKEKKRKSPRGETGIQDF